ncbi:MAG: hypothetical protein IT538_02575 [Variibacter sp.]|nr:hypothetical protein [Variibacter sp.]
MSRSRACAYLNEHEDETKHAVEQEGRRCIPLSGDVANPEFCTQAVAQTAGEVRSLAEAILERDRHPLNRHRRA